MSRKASLQWGIFPLFCLFRHKLPETVRIFQIDAAFLRRRVDLLSNLHQASGEVLGRRIGIVYALNAANQSKALRQGNVKAVSGIL